MPRMAACFVPVELSMGAEYVARVKAYARRDSTNEIQLTFMVDEKPVKVTVIELVAAMGREGSN